MWVSVMCERRYFALILALLLLSACIPAAQQIVVLPTLAALPTSTPVPTDTPSPTRIPPSPTPNLLETQVAQLQATNDAAQITLAAMLTERAPTATPNVTLTPSHTITQTLIPSLTPLPVVAMLPQLIYVRSTANVRACASRDCEQVAQLQPGEVIMATGTIQGEMIDGGNALWFRVEYGGREVYIYSQLVSLSPPTAVPVFVPPPTNPPIFAAPPVSSGGCPSLSATCSMLTCEQAYACLAAGNTRLDGDSDGIPCESICA